jgi:hypothetical protein
MLDKKTDPNYKPIQFTTQQLSDRYDIMERRIEKEQRTKHLDEMVIGGTRKVIILGCTVAGICKRAFMTGTVHTNNNGTRYEIITYNKIRRRVQQLWLCDWDFNVIPDGDNDD